MDFTADSYLRSLIGDKSVKIEERVEIGSAGKGFEFRRGGGLVEQRGF